MPWSNIEQEGPSLVGLKAALLSGQILGPGVFGLFEKMGIAADRTDYQLYKQLVFKQHLLL